MKQPPLKTRLFKYNCQLFDSVHFSDLIKLQFRSHTRNQVLLRASGLRALLVAWWLVHVVSKVADRDPPLLIL